MSVCPNPSCQDSEELFGSLFGTRQRYLATIFLSLMIVHVRSSTAGAISTCGYLTDGWIAAHSWLELLWAEEWRCWWWSRWGVGEMRVKMSPLCFSSPSIPLPLLSSFLSLTSSFFSPFLLFCFVLFRLFCFAFFLYFTAFFFGLLVLFFSASALSCLVLSYLILSYLILFHFLSLWHSYYLQSGGEFGQHCCWPGFSLLHVFYPKLDIPHESS